MRLFQTIDRKTEGIGSTGNEKTIEPADNATFRMPLMAGLAAAIGIIAGFVAFALYSLIAIVSNLVFFHKFSMQLGSILENPLGLWILVVPAIGGLIIGLMAKYGSKKIQGHGIPEAMEAVLVNKSRIAPKVAILKPISAAIAIGTGGPFGAEGPIIQTGGAIGSLIGQLLHTTASERKVLLACGAAAGMAATFSTPIAAVILAIELLLFEFKSRSFIPLVIASTLATTIHFFLMGRGPMFDVPHVDFGIPSAIPFYVLLGVICGLAATGFSRALYWIEDLYERLPVDEIWLPAIGGLGLGIIGYFMPRVLGVGYETISSVLSAQLPLTILLLIVVFKGLALLVSLGSGTSGGLLAPMFMVGAALGGAFAIVMNMIFPGAHLSPGAFALVGMAAMFGAASRATFTFIIFAFEITRDYDAILPLMLVCVIADGIGLLLMRNSIMTEKLARRGLHVPQEYEADVLQQVTVSDVMEQGPPRVPPSMTLGELTRSVGEVDSLLMRHHAVLVVDASGHLAGIVTRGDALRKLEEGASADTTVMEAGSGNLVTAYPDERLSDAVARMLSYGVGRMPVVARDNSREIAGYLSRASILKARMRRLDEEQNRERGWLNVRNPVSRRGREARSAARRKTTPEKD